MGTGIVGIFAASPPAVAIAGMLVAAVLVDAVRFFWSESRDPMAQLIRSADPNPCSVGQSVTVRLVPQVDGTRGRGGRRAWVPEVTQLAETVPVPLVSGTKLRGVDAREHNAGLIYDLCPPHRGQWILGPCFATRTSALGLWKAQVTDSSTCQITVWPRTAALEVQVVAPDREGQVGAKGFLHPHQDNVTVRQYSTGDDFRRVHWRSSARRGELMTRADEPTDSDRSWVGLILPLNAAPDVRELAISLAASWILGLDIAGFEVDLACGGQVSHGSAATHLTSLAVLTNEQAGLPLRDTTPEGVSLLIVAQSATRPIPPGLILHPSRGRDRASGSASALAVVLCDTADAALTVESAGWRTLQLGSGTGLTEACARVSQVLAPVQTTRSR
ncbi:MAG: DUF58 domain-containing protein [Propionibacteriaceae bacterium]|nr:DUF58 domain-containing protein [Propionibacteriaceae bacterium]